MTAPTVLHLLEQVWDKRPDLRPEDGQQRSAWPIYTTNRNLSDEQMMELWGLMAEERGVRFYKHIQDLEAVMALLNSTSHEALVSGVIWVKRYNHMTRLERRTGVTYHPSLAGNDVALVLPSGWHELFYLMFPYGEPQPDDAARAVTLTAEIDGADYHPSNMTDDMNAAIQYMETGILSAQPQHADIDSVAFGRFTQDFMQDHHFIPFKEDAETRDYWIFVTDPNNVTVKETVERYTQMQVQLVLMTVTDEQIFWANHLASPPFEAQIDPRPGSQGALSTGD